MLTSTRKETPRSSAGELSPGGNIMPFLPIASSTYKPILLFIYFSHDNTLPFPQILQVWTKPGNLHVYPALPYDQADERGWG